MASHKRRHFFINKDFQGRYIFSAFISVVVGSILFALLFGFFSSNTLSIVYENYHLKLGTTPSLLLDKIFSTQWLFIILGGIAMAILSLFLSHRVAGPFFRFESALDKIIEKDLSEGIRLRRKDEGKILGEKINRFSEMLSDDLLQVQEAAVKIRRCCDAVESFDYQKGSHDVLKAELQNIRRYNEKTLDILSMYKLGSR